jgi:hypothetical protein
MKIQMFSIILATILVLMLTVEGQTVDNGNAKDDSPLSEEGCFCCTCPDYSNLQNWMNNSAVCCSQKVPRQANCTEGCVCLTEDVAQERFEIPGKQSYEICSNNSSNGSCCCNPDGEIRHCYRAVSLMNTCPEGCNCLTKAEAELKFDIPGKQSYKACSEAICGYNSTGEPRNCYKAFCTACQKAEAWSSQAEAFLSKQ